MFSDKKGESGKLPDLPPVKSPFGSAASMQVQEGSHALPSFPDSQQGSSQTAIKDAVAGPASVLPDVPGGAGIKVVEMHEWTPTNLPAQIQPPQQQTMALHSTPPQTRELPALPPRQPAELVARLPELPHERHEIAPPPMASEAPPVHERVRGGGIHYPVTPKPAGVDVFVKIDKFHSAKKTLRDVGNSLEEIDSLIKKIREVKLREEQEIASWEKDVVNAKTRIQEISENIFEKVG